VVLLVAPLLALAEGIARQPWPAALGIAAALFAGGWALQLMGHRHEGNRPAFLHNLSHLLYAPALLAAELLFAVGLKQGLREEIEGRIATHAAPGAARPVRAVDGARWR
jgi:uncharacterized membrane protein YGL010W